MYENVLLRQSVRPTQRRPDGWDCARFFGAGFEFWQFPVTEPISPSCRYLLAGTMYYLRDVIASRWAADLLVHYPID